MEDAFHGALHEALLDPGAFSSGLFWIWTFIFMRFDKFLACFSPCISHRDFTGSEGISLRTLPDPDFRFYAALHGLVAFFMDRFTLDLQAPAHERSPEYFAPR